MSISATNMINYGFNFSEEDINEFKKFWKTDSLSYCQHNEMKKLVSRCSCGELHIVNGEYYDHDAYFCKDYYCDKCGKELNTYLRGITKEEIIYLKNKYHVGG